MMHLELVTKGNLKDGRTLDHKPLFAVCQRTTYCTLPQMQTYITACSRQLMLLYKNMYFNQSDCSNMQFKEVLSAVW